MTKPGKREREKVSGFRGIAYLGFAAAGLLFIIMIWSASHPSSPLQAGAASNRQTAVEQYPDATEPVPPYFTSAVAARPFPVVLPAVDFKSYPSVQIAYAVAAEIPGVLAQQPCYCHCDRMGHRSLLDCYASDHAAGCGVCLMEAIFAQRMTGQGQDAASIRREIIRGGWRNVQLREPLPW